MQSYYSSNGVTIYNCDIAEVLMEFSQFDLLLTDPPYGLDQSWLRKWHGSNGVTKLWGVTPEWDKLPVEIGVMQDLVGKAKNAIVWGGNFYPFPPSRCWFIWDKLQTDYGSDCEMAWTNLDLAPKVFRVSRIDAYRNKAKFKKVHPNEKPVQLSSWALKYTKPKTMLDGFMGTGNSLVAGH